MPQYSSSAGPIARGNAFLVQTPETTDAVNKLYQQEYERKQRAQQNADALDQQMAQDMGKIRGVDIPEFTKAYQDYKTSQTDVLSNKKLQNDPIAMAAARQKSVQALSKVYGTIAASKQAKQDQEDLNKVYLAHPEKFVDNFSDMHEALQNTPVSKLKNAMVGDSQVDLSSPDAFYDMTPRADLSKLMINAAGKPTNERDYTDVANPTDNQSTDRTIHKFGADPLSFTESLKNQFHTKAAEKTAASAWNMVKPEDVAAVQAAYNQIPADRWKKMTGTAVPQDLNFDNAQSDAEKYAIFQGMKYAIQAPIGSEIKTIKNQQATTEINQANRKEMAGIQLKNALIKIHAGSTSTLDRESAFDDIVRNRNLVSKEQANDTADSFVSNEVKNAQKPENAVSYTTTTGAKIDGYKISVKPEVTNQLTFPKGIHKTQPEETIYDPKTNTIVGIKKHTNDDGLVVVETKSMPMTQVNLTYRSIINKGHSDKEGGATTTKGKKVITGF